MGFVDEGGNLEREIRTINGIVEISSALVGTPCAFRQVQTCTRPPSPSPLHQGGKTLHHC